MKKRSSTIRPGATRVSSGLCFGFRRMPCHAKEPLGQGFFDTAGIFGAGRAGQLPVAEKEGGVGHHICKL